MPEVDTTNVGQRLTIVRGALTQAAFARRLGVSKDTVGNYERNLRSPDADFLITLDREFGVNLHWLLTGEEQQKSDHAGNMPAIDTDLLKDCVVVTESLISLIKRDITIEKKAAFITALYSKELEGSRRGVPKLQYDNVVQLFVKISEN